MLMHVEEYWSLRYFGNYYVELRYPLSPPTFPEPFPVTDWKTVIFLLIISQTAIRCILILLNFSKSKITNP